MSKANLQEVISQLVGLQTRDPEELETLFATQLVASDDNPYTRIFDFEIAQGPFERGDLRHSADDKQGHISLWPRQNLELTEADLEFLDWGQVVDIKINPQIQPEGVDSYVFDMDNIQLTVQLTHKSRILRSVAIDWGS
jgi:hypothetical protein